MGLYSGAVALCRYRLTGAESAKPLDAKLYKLKTYQAGPLKLDGEAKELQAAWMLPPDLYGADSERLGDYWDLSDCRLEDGYVLRLRIARRKVPQEFFQLLFKQTLAEKNRGREKPLGRSAQKALRDELKEALLRQALPSITYVDAFWQDDGELMVFTSSKSNREVFEDLFRKTFSQPAGRMLMRIDPPLLALSPHDWQAQAGTAALLEKMEKLLPTSFRVGSDMAM